VQLNLVRLGKRDARLLESKFDAAAKLARNVVLAIEDGPGLKAKDGAVEGKGFDAQDARAVDEGLRPIGVIAKIAGDFFEGGESAADHFIAGHGNVDEGLRPVAAEILDLADESVGNGDEGAVGGANDGAAKREVLDAAGFAVDLDEIANDELIFEDDEEAVDEVFDERLCSKAESEAADGGNGGDGRDVEAKLGEHGEDGATQDDCETRAIENACHRARLFLTHDGDARGRLGQLNEALGKRFENADEDERDQENEEDAQAVRGGRFGPLGERRWHREERDYITGRKRVRGGEGLGGEARKNRRRTGLTIARRRCQSLRAVERESDDGTSESCDADRGEMKKLSGAIALALVFGLFSPLAGAQWRPLNPVTGVAKQADGVILTMKTGVLRLQVLTDSMIRVTYAPGASIPNETQYIVTKTSWPAAQWNIDSTDADVTLTTARMRIRVTRRNGAILYTDASGQKLFEDGERSLTPVEVNGEKTYHSEMSSGLWDSSEAFYGLGQHQAGVWNYHGEAVDLVQNNTNISVPFFVSTRGYGILWNNTSRSLFDNRFLHALYLTSDVADTVDYYFLYGPDFDRIIAGYRELTGEAPLFGKWAYGFWQCKNRYNSQEELLSIAKKYRDMQIPMDNIVQDWFWWNTMGEPVFNKNYPDPKAMIADLHAEHVHIMFSFWPYFNPGSPVYDDMEKKGYFIDKMVVGTGDIHPKGQALYDAFNPAARKYYWGLLDKVFQLGADAWWLDTDEPETENSEKNILETEKVALGNGARYSTMFPLMHTEGVYEGQRSASDQKRVFILSRSAFAGAQRNSITAWSGDVEANWLSFARQVPAGLNYELSGLPYWTTDIGGFVSGNPDDPAYQELFVRWFEYGTFCPIFRVHGTRTPSTNELWSYGPDAQQILASFDRLRYRLMPYIYSLAWKVTNEGYTPMRPLVMDFESDVRAQNIGDEFLYGPALLVNPVTEAGATSRSVYLPDAKWYDFWTGHATMGRADVNAAAPLDRIPLYVRAGSILPMGPDEQYSNEKPADPVELRVYTGADGSFTLYEDENDNYDYEKGVHATIPIHWDDASHTLTIGERQGQFPGMLQSRTFQIVFVGEGHGIGIGATGTPDKVVTYDGKEVSVTP